LFLDKRLEIFQYARFQIDDVVAFLARRTQANLPTIVRSVEAIAEIYFLFHCFSSLGLSRWGLGLVFGILVFDDVVSHVPKKALQVLIVVG
jgi:hypothetical protein